MISPAIDTNAGSNSEQIKQIEKWRSFIETGLKEIGIKPEQALKKFDTKCDTLLKKKNAFDLTEKFVIAEKKQQVLEALGNQPWSLDEIDRELKTFGLEKGLDFATNEQILTIWRSYKNGRMI